MGVTAVENEDDNLPLAGVIKSDILKTGKYVLTVYKRLLKKCDLTFYLRFRIIFPVWLLNRLISAGLEVVLSHTEKLCIASYYRQFSTNIKIKIIKLTPVFLALAFGPSG